MTAPAAGNRFRCETCGTEIIVVKAGDAVPSCCDEPMAAR
jgi:desulfoferrodoxin-like iron-binding protein